MKGKQKETGMKMFEEGGFATPSNTFIRDHAKSLEYKRQRWFKAHAYRGTKAEVGGKHGS